jgi:hypothetical protein
MKRLMNAVETMLDESLDGFAAAHADIVGLGAERKFVRRRTLTRGKIALISGGGTRPISPSSRRASPKRCWRPRSASSPPFRR